jgi:glutamate/tyrosine decarboxylase-like PLP-dependent enzyme
MAAALDLARREATAYLAAIATSPVQPQARGETVVLGEEPLPEHGSGTIEALESLAAQAQAGATRSSGPRFFHFVMGGATPAALAGDWLASAFDQVAYSRQSSGFATDLEAVAVRWLAELFDLPAQFQGVLVSGATMANITCLAAARHWWSEQLGADVDRDGFAGLPRPLVLASGHLHPSDVQALGMLGLGQANVERYSSDEAGNADLAAIEQRLRESESPAILIGSAGEVNAGAFDPIDEMADLAERYGAWLHVDGAFGIFARLASTAAHLAAGIERADSIAGDAHKWLNVPYDSGFAFVREPRRLAAALNVGAPYLPEEQAGQIDFGFISPENSRRARSLAVWATLRAYGRDGYRGMVERHLALAQHLAARVDASESFERLAEVPLNIVCFRAHPPGIGERELDELNRRLGEELIADGRVYAGTTVYAGKVALRPAIVNWMTQEADVDALLEVLEELLDR